MNEDTLRINTVLCHSQHKEINKSQCVMLGAYTCSDQIVSTLVISKIQISTVFHWSCVHDVYVSTPTAASPSRRSRDGPVGINLSLGVSTCLLLLATLLVEFVAGSHCIHLMNF